MLRRAIALVALAVLLAWASPAQAGDVLRPGSKPWFATFALGPSIFVEPSGHTLFKMSQEIGHHFSGDASGFALGLSIEESFVRMFRLGVGPKLWYDIQPSDDLGIYITPGMRLGYGYWSAGGASASSFALQIPLAVRMVLGDAGMVYFQPITPDMYINEGFAMTWDIMFGGGAIF